MKKTSMKNLLLSLGILTIVAPASITLISCAGDNGDNPGDGGGENPGDGGGDIKPPPIDPPIDNRIYVNWSEDANLTSKLEDDNGSSHKNINLPEGGITSTTHKIGKWVDGENGKVWEPEMYNLHFKLDSYQMKSIGTESEFGTPNEAETLYNQGFAADIPVYFNENGELRSMPTQIEPGGTSAPYAKWTGKTSNPNILYTTAGGIRFLNMNGEGMSFTHERNIKSVQTATLDINTSGDPYSGWIDGDQGTIYAADGEESKYTNIPNTKPNRYYSLFNSKFSFTVSKPIINQDK